MRIIKSSLYKFLLSKVKELDYVQLWGSFLEIFGYITSINNQINSLILSKEFLDILDLMIDHREMLIRKRVGWVINNIMNGNSDILEVIIAHNIFRKFLNKLSLDQIDVRAELLSALLGYLSCANND